MTGEKDFFLDKNLVDYVQKQDDDNCNFHTNPNGNLQIDCYEIVIDPFDNIGYPLPTNLFADLVLISHEHHDHNNIALLKGTPAVFRTPGSYQFKQAQIELIQVFHDNSGGSQRGKNNLIKITADGYNLVHCGDLGHLPDIEVLAKIGKPDILMIPVGEIYTLSLQEVWSFIKALEPILVFPMHYRTPNLRFGLGELSAFLKNAPHYTTWGSESIEISADLLEKPDVIVMKTP